MSNNDGLRRFYPPVVSVPMEQEEMVEEQERPEGDGKAVWVGAPDAPGQADDGISDLFETGTKGEEDDLRDLTSVDVDADIIDVDPDTGDLSDLTDVTEEDVLGDEDTGQFPDATPYQQRMMKRARPARRTTRYTPPTSMGGIRG